MEETVHRHLHTPFGLDSVKIRNEVDGFVTLKRRRTSTLAKRLARRAAQHSMDDAVMQQDAPGDEERLRECYHAFLARRLSRGSRSIRTRRGYEHLRANYQPRVRFLLEQAVSDGDEPSSQHAGDSLKELVGPYIDKRVLQFVAEVCWPLAHLGPQSIAVRKQIPEWQELPSSRYFAVMVSILLWMFPGLPSFEVQELMERDWQNDRDFDPFGNEGLSLEGFTVSFIDLAVACTNGNVDRCIEFLKLLVDRLESSLAPVHEQFDQNESDKHHDTAPPGLPAKQLKWISIPLGQLVPCKARQKPEYYELKAKASTAPMVLMVLASNEKPFELQLSSSSKLLVRERDSRTSIRRKTIAMKTHLIELEKQILWTMRDWTPAHPSVFLIPNTSLSQRAQKLFACLRLLDSHEQELHRGVFDNNDLSSVSPLLTLYSSIQDPVELEYRAEESSVGRIERMGSQLFVLDHRGRQESFVVSIKSSLLHNTNAAGGIGAAAIVSATQIASTRASIGDTDMTSSLYAKDSAAHTFVFVVKDQREFAAPTSFGVHRQNGVLPQQWFCSMSAADETKTLAIHPQSKSECCSASGLYYLYIFSLHGMYYEVSYQDNDSILEADEVSNRKEESPVANRNPRGNEVACTFTECDHSDDEEDLAEVTKAANGSSTVLLRCLLKLRQKRKDKAQAAPLPSFIEGTKVEKMKAVSAAVTLRSKFLKAREMARQARVLEQEQAFADNLKELLIKHSDSFRRGAPTPKPSVGDPDPLSEAKLDQKRSGFEDQMQLLASFFREMAVHVPSEADPSTQGIMYRPADEQLLREFGDLFERDSKLLNMLDEEKWESEEVQRARKAAMLDEQLRNRGTTRGQCGGMSIGNGNLLHEDYMGTAAYIEELMRTVAEEEDDGKFANIISDDQVNEDKRFQNLQASWAYAQLRTNSAQRRLRHTDQKMEHFEHQRREEWMKSHYVTDLARQARFSRPSSPARAALTFSRTGFEHQQEELPWNPIWEAHEDTGLGDQHQPLSPTPSQERPKQISPAKSGVPIVSHNQRVRRSHGRDETAVKSASLSYARRLRIERVRSAPPTKSPRKVAINSAPPSRPPSSPSQVPHTPSSAFSHDVGFLHLEESTSPFKTSPTPEEIALVYTSEACAAEISFNAKCNELSSSSFTVEITTAKLHQKPRQKRHGTRSKRETPMSQRIKELLSMSETARRVSQSPEEDNWDKLFPASSDLPIPAKDKPKCWCPR